LTVDEGAVRALKAGKSLLPSGVVSVSGEFEKGESLRLLDASGAVIGVGLAAYPADEIALIRGGHSDEIEGLIGYRGPSVVIHRDDLVLENR
jgi:glutamate 5-kinase